MNKPGAKDFDDKVCTVGVLWIQESDHVAGGHGPRVGTGSGEDGECAAADRQRADLQAVFVVRADQVIPVTRLTVGLGVYRITQPR